MQFGHVRDAPLSSVRLRCCCRNAGSLPTQLFRGSRKLSRFSHRESLRTSCFGECLDDALHVFPAYADCVIGSAILAASKSIEPSKDCPFIVPIRWVRADRCIIVLAATAEFPFKARAKTPMVRKDEHGAWNSAVLFRHVPPPPRRATQPELRGS